MPAERMSSPPHGVMFHHFHAEGERPTAQGSITEGDLRRIIEYVGGEKILPARQWQRKAIAHALDDGDICLTFDDALNSQIEVALPVLKEYDITAFWFVYSSVFLGDAERFEIYRCFYNEYFEGFPAFYGAFKDAVIDSEFGGQVRSGIGRFAASGYLSEYGFYSDEEREYRFVRDQILGRERFGTIMDHMMEHHDADVEGMAWKLWMGNDDLRTLVDAGHVVGLHSFSHPTDLKSLSVVQQEEEYRSNYRHIREVTGQDPLTMSHPVNSYSEDTLQLLESMGIKIGFRSNLNQRQHSDLEYPREDHVNILAAL